MQYVQKRLQPSSILTYDTPLALWWFAKAVYPDLFEDIDIPLKVKEYYGRFYGMELTDGEVEKLLSPGAEMRRDFF